MSGIKVTRIATAGQELSGGSTLDATYAGTDVDVTTGLPIDGLLDVNAPAPDDGDGIVWDAGSSAWVNAHALTEDDVVALITPDIYACVSLTVIGGQGVIATGAHTDLHAVGGTTVEIEEESGTPGFNIEAAFTGVDDITDVYVHGYYTATHTATVQLYNYDTTDWDTVLTFSTGGTSMELLHGAISDGTPYFDGGGNAVVRFYHAAAGNPTHRLYLDYLAISHVAGSTGSLALDGLSDVDTTGKADQDVLTWDDGTSTWIAAPGGGGQTVAIVAVFDGGGSEIADNVQLDIEVPFACTLTAWRILADASGAIVIDVWKDTYANFPPTDADAMPGSGKEPTIAASAAKAEDTTITDWTTDDISAGDILRFNVDSCTTITRATLTLTATRS